MRKIVRKSDFQQFERSFWRVSREMGYLWKEVYEKTLPGSQSHILYLLGRNGPKKMSELAEVLHLTPGAVTTASDRLIECGYIARSRDETDRRIVRLELTTKGEKTLNELQNKGRKIMKIVFDDLSDEDLQMMNTIFKQATKNIDNIGGI